LIYEESAVHFFKKLLLIGCFSFYLTPMVWALESYDRVGENELAFFTYRPIYYGFSAYHNDHNSTGESKYQFSFKYELFGESSWYLAYTQKTIWSTQANSAPMKETNYRPEIFYGLQTDSEGMPYVQFGLYNHESNGEPEGTSLQWETHYVEPIFKFDAYTIRLTLWIPFLFKSEDKVTGGRGELFDYYGNGEIEIRYDQENLGHHELLYREGKDNGVYALRYQFHMDLSDYVKSLDENGWNTTLLLQAFHGYGETLATYNVRTTRLLLGISLVH
jgi:outer membrane phospholipase A